MKEERGSFSGKLGFVLAAAGSAVGLGNLWRFPYLAAQYGGGIFILVYIILALTFGFTLMATEIGIGRKTKKSGIRAYTMLHEKFVFLGAQKNPFGFMRGAMAHILSSRAEGMGVVLVEAMLAGTLNIASDCKNGPREILMDGKAGLLFRPGDADGLAQHMENVWKNDVPVDSMIKMAEKSCNRFNAENIIPSVVDVIKCRMP